MEGSPFLTYLRHIFCVDVPDFEEDIAAAVADEGRRGRVAVVQEAERLGPPHLSMA